MKANWDDESDKEDQTDAKPTKPVEPSKLKPDKPDESKVGSGDKTHVESESEEESSSEEEEEEESDEEGLTPMEKVQRRIEVSQIESFESMPRLVTTPLPSLLDWLIRNVGSATRLKGQRTLYVRRWCVCLVMWTRARLRSLTRFAGPTSRMERLGGLRNKLERPSYPQKPYESRLRW